LFLSYQRSLQVLVYRFWSSGWGKCPRVFCGFRLGTDFFVDRTKERVIVEDLTTNTELSWPNSKGVLLTIRAMQ